jgi:hypothetical protein
MVSFSSIPGRTTGTGTSTNVIEFTTFLMFFTIHRRAKSRTMGKNLSEKKAAKYQIYLGGSVILLV